MPKTAKLEERDRADQTRTRILQAAVAEFSQHGLAGARTDAIAQAAQVNKGLLYYYFKGKDDLYAATLEHAAGKIAESSMTALDSGKTSGESLLRLALNHFDRLSSHNEFQSLMQQEMVRFHRGESDVLPMLARSLYKPLLKRAQAVIREGIRTGELCDADWLQILYTALGANIFYFLSLPVMRIALPADSIDRLTPDTRRTAALELLGQSVFQDRAQGRRLAQRVLASAPKLQAKGIPARRCS